MPSPFPGMDPYLEASDRFRDFHNSLIVSLKYDLQPRLPEGFFAQTNRRLWLEGGETAKYPDLGVSDETGGGFDGYSASDLKASMTVGRPTVVDAPVPEPTYETLLEIRRRVGREDQIVTALEVVSPTNKRPGDNARGAYLQKQREYLASPISLIELDLLRGGTHVTAVASDELRATAGRFDYHVCLRHAAAPGRFLTYPFTLRDPLPELPVPLGPDRTPLRLDLQAVFTSCFDLSRYREQLSYAAAPPPPRLSADDAVWCDELLREAGLRTAD